MAYTLSLTQSQSLAALRGVLLQALPSGIECIQGEDNRLPEPLGPDFIIFWPILRTRLATNISNYQDCAFAGSVSGTTLTVSSIIFGAINIAAQPTLYGLSVASGTRITAQLTGAAGGVGTYAVSRSQTVSSGPLAAGLVGMTAPTQLTVQIDVHGPSSGDNVQIISTLLRSSYGVDQFFATGYDITPLYAGDPRQMPWSNAENQIERVWSVDAVLQANSIVYVPQQFFSALSIAVKPPVDLTEIVLNPYQIVASDGSFAAASDGSPWMTWVSRFDPASPVRIPSSPQWRLIASDGSLLYVGDASTILSN